MTDHEITGREVTRSQSKDKLLLKVAKTNISKREWKGSTAATNSTSNVSEMTSLRLTNERLRRVNEMLVKKMKPCTVKVAENATKTKRLYKTAARKKKELETKTSVQRLSSERNEKTVDSQRQDERNLCKELNQLKKAKERQVT